MFTPRNILLKNGFIYISDLRERIFQGHALSPDNNINTRKPLNKIHKERGMKI